MFRAKNLYRETGGVVMIGLIPDEGLQLSLFEPPLKKDNLKRKLNRLKGESKRKHLSIPMIR